MISNTRLTGAALALALTGPIGAPPALAADPIGYQNGAGDPNTTAVSPQTPLPVTVAGAGPYALLANASASGAPVGGIAGGAYIFSCTAAAWGGATLTLKALGPDRSTYLTVASGGAGAALTANGALGVVLGGNATAEVVVSGGAPTGANCTLS